jgi:hypothetical protein
MSYFMTVSGITPDLSGLEPIEETQLYRLLNRLSTGNHALRIWYAGRDAEAHLRVKDCESLEAAVQKFQTRRNKLGGSVSVPVFNWTDQPLAFLTSSTSAGTTSKRSPTMP